MKPFHSFQIPAFLAASSIFAFFACGGDPDTSSSAGSAGAAAMGGNGGSSGHGGQGNEGGLLQTGGNFPVGGGTTGTTMTTTTTTSTSGGGPCESAMPVMPSTIWEKKAGAADVQAVLGVAVDAQGNIGVVGDFLGSIDLGTGALNSAGMNDAFVAKLKSDGTAIWAKSFGDAGFHQHAQNAAFDAQGNMAVTGHFRGTINFGGGTLTNASNFFEDIFIAKLDSNGGHVWSKNYGDINSEESHDIATDAQGNIYAVGAFQKTINFGGSVITAESGGFNAFVVKLSAIGDQQWSKSFGDITAEQKALGMTVDKDGNVYVVGYHLGSIDFGGGALTAPGTERHAFVAKLTTAGSYVWASSYGVDAEGIDVAVDAAGEVYVTGNFKGMANFGGKDFSAGSANNVFVLKLDKDGKHLWSKSFGEPSAAEEVTSVALDGDKPAVLGTFTKSIDFGGGALQSGGGYDVFLAKLDKDGCELHASVFGGPMLQRAQTLAIDSTGNIVFGGSFDGSVDFGTGPLTADTTDAYVVKTKP